MPTSIDPPLADDEIECARCGARFHYELTRCPNCGINLYDPEDDADLPHAKQSRSASSQMKRMGTGLEGLLRRITKKPYPVDTLFGAAINQAELYNNLLTKVGGDNATVERLITFEQELAPKGNRILWLENSIRRWEKDNQTPGSTV